MNVVLDVAAIIADLTEWYKMALMLDFKCLKQRKKAGDYVVWMIWRKGTLSVSTLVNY